MDFDSEPEEVRQLFDNVWRCLTDPVSFEGMIVRSSGIKYANKRDFISGRGAAIAGGRWNPIGLKAIYGSLTPATAVQESYKEMDD